MYYDEATCCKCSFNLPMGKEVGKRSDKTASTSGDGVFTKHEASFIISDDLLILPNRTETSFDSFLGIMDTDKLETWKLNLGLAEIMSLLKASLTSPTPLSDVILNKTTRMECSPFKRMENEEDPHEKKISLQALVCTHTCKVLYTKAKEDFIELLFSFLFISLGGAEHLVAGKTGIKAIDSFYQSTAALIDDNFFKSPDTKNRLMKPNLVHGCVSLDHILPLSEESLPEDYSKCKLSSVKFPKGQGIYLKRPQTYLAKDDLTVEPFSIISIIPSLKDTSHVKEVEMEIGLKETHKYKVYKERSFEFVPNLVRFGCSHSCCADSKKE